MSNWKKCSLGQVVTFASGSSFSEKYQGMKNEQYDFYKVSDMNTCENNKFMIKAENTISNETSNKIKAKIHPKNTVIFPKVGAALLTNKRRITTKDSIFDNNIMGLIATEEIDYLFLYYFMSSVDLGKYVQTGAIPSVNNTIIENIMVQLPPMVEQQKIAEILSSVDAAIEKTEQVIAKTEEVKKGLMQQLLTKGIGHTEFKQTEFGEIPITWKVTPLIEIVNKTQLGTNDVANSEYGLPLIKMGNLTFGGFDFKKLEYINNPKVDYSNYYLNEGDFLFNTRNTPELVGKSAVWHKEKEAAIYNNNILKIIFNDTVNSDYMCYQFNNGLCFSTIRGLATGTTSVAAIYWKDLSKIKVAIPDKQEQDKICSILKYHEKKVQNEQKKIDELNKIKQGLMQQLLTGKTRVKEATMYSFLKELGYCE